MHGGALFPIVALLITACGADAGVPDVTVTVGTVEVTCRAEAALPDADACREWGRGLLDRQPDADRLTIIRHPGGSDAGITPGRLLAAHPVRPPR